MSVTRADCIPRRPSRDALQTRLRRRQVSTFELTPRVFTMLSSSASALLAMQPQMSAGSAGSVADAILVLYPLKWYERPLAC